jgi:site-specific DNA recombinase
MSETSLTKKVAIYARVSPGAHEEEETIKNQIMALHDYAATHNLEIVKTYEDDQWSGDLLARPALDLLRQEMKQNMFDAVLIYDPDRLARRYSYQELVTDEIKEAGVEVIFVTVSVPKNSEEKILYGVRGLFAEYERTKIAERFRLGRLRKARSGITFTDVPYGYTYNLKRGTEPGTVTINEEEAKVVRMIFGWHRDGVSIRGIIRNLKEEEIMPRRAKRDIWCTSVIGRLLRNTWYIGEGYWGKFKSVMPKTTNAPKRYKRFAKTGREKRPKEEWIGIPFPRIIEDELFYAVQAQLKKAMDESPRNRKYHYMLKGLIFCSCGKRMAGESVRQGKNLYYRCTDRILSYPYPRTCKAKPLNARLVEDRIWKIIYGIMISSDKLTTYIESWQERKKKRGFQIFDTDSLKAEAEKITKQIDRYNQAFAAEMLTLEQLKTYVTPLNNRLSRINEKMREITDKQNSQDVEIQLPAVKDIKDFVSRLSEMDKEVLESVKTQIVQQTVDMIESSTHGDYIKVRGNIKPYKLLSDLDYVVLNANHRYGWDVNHTSEDAEKIAVPFEFSLSIHKTH